MAINDILLRVLGDGSDAERELADLATDLSAFDRIEAEAKATLDADQLRRELREAKTRLADLSRVEATPQIEVATTKAKVEIKALEARLALLAAKDYDVEVNVDTDRGAANLRGFLGLVKRAWDAIGDGLGNALAKTGGNMAGFGGQAGEAGAQVGVLGKIAGVAAGAIGLILFAAIGAAVTALAALISSAAMATAGLGALAIAAGGALVPAIGLAIGAIKRFKDQADEAGTAAHALKVAGERVGDVFSRVLGPAADAVFRGLARGLNALAPALRTLKPAFTAFGRAAGDALERLAKALASPQIVSGFRALVRGAKAAVRPLVDAFTSLLQIVLNIARAAMPLLVGALRDVARWLRGIADATFDIDNLRESIGGLVDHLRSWLELGKQIGRIFVGIFTAAAGSGKELVDTLAQGAEKLADWIQSAEGQERIKQFFEETLPLVKRMIDVLGQLSLAFILAFQAAAPAIEFVLSAIEKVLRVINFVLEAFNKIPPAIRSWVVPISGAVRVFSNLAAGMAVLGPVASKIGAAIKSAFSSAVGAVTEAWNTLKEVASTVWDGIRTAIVTAARGARDGAKAAFNTLRSASAGAWRGIKTAAGTIWSAIKTVIVTFVRTSVALATGDFGRLKEIAGKAFGAVLAAAGRILGRVADAVAKAINAALKVLASAVSAFFDAGVSLVAGLARGIRSEGQKAIDAAKDIADKVKDAVEDVLLPGSPSRVMIELGQNVSRGLAIGIAQAADEVTREAARVAQLASMPQLVPLPAPAGPSRSITQNTQNTQHVTITPLAAGGYPDAPSFAAQLSREIRLRGG